MEYTVCEYVTPDGRRCLTNPRGRRFCARHEKIFSKAKPDPKPKPNCFEPKTRREIMMQIHELGETCPINLDLMDDNELKTTLNQLKEKQQFRIRRQKESDFIKNHIKCSVNILRNQLSKLKEKPKPKPKPPAKPVANLYSEREKTLEDARRERNENCNIRSPEYWGLTRSEYYSHDRPIKRATERDCLGMIAGWCKYKYPFEDCFLAAKTLHANKRHESAIFQEMECHAESYRAYMDAISCTRQLLHQGFINEESKGGLRWKKKKRRY